MTERNPPNHEVVKQLAKFFLELEKGVTPERFKEMQEYFEVIHGLPLPRTILVDGKIWIKEKFLTSSLVLKGIRDFFLPLIWMKCGMRIAFLMVWNVLVILEFVWR